MEIGLDAGAEDIQTDEEGMIEVICAPNDYPAVKAAFEQASLTPEVQDVVMKALSETELTGDDAVKMQKMLDALEGLDDVQEVYRSEEHTSELQSLMRISYAVFCLKKKKYTYNNEDINMNSKSKRKK